MGLAKNKWLMTDSFTFWKTPQNLMISISIPVSSFVSRITAEVIDSPSSTRPPGISQPLFGPLRSKISLFSFSTTAAATTVCFGD
ncbi:hypothetical protein D3C71_1844930 [compost metagenome]